MFDQALFDYLLILALTVLHPADREVDVLIRPRRGANPERGLLGASPQR